MIKCKRGLSFSGHIYWAVLLGFFGIFLYGEFIGEISIKLILINLPFYLVGSFIIDRIETPNSAWHRVGLHSWKSFFVISFILIPVVFTLGFFRSSDWYFIMSILAGMITHLLGDALTRRGLN